MRKFRVLTGQSDEVERELNRLRQHSAIIETAHGQPIMTMAADTNGKVTIVVLCDTTAHNLATALD